jgi:serine/threonine protein kinase
VRSRPSTTKATCTATSLDNIQIQDNGLPVLLDFGSARRTIGNLSDETETMLRPGFAPIEQYTDDNESEQGPWTDIYALGAVLRTLIVGSPPPVSVVRSIQDTCKPLVEIMPQGYSIPLLQAIDRALALHMEDRPQSIDEFAALIEMPVAGINDVLTAKKPAPCWYRWRRKTGFAARLASLQDPGHGCRRRAGRRCRWRDAV